MTTPTIQKKIARGCRLKRLLAKLEKELKAIKVELIEEAEGHAEEHKPTEGGGWSWEALDARGNVARVTEPARSLKAVINPYAADFKKIEEIAGANFALLFAPVDFYTPVEKFRDEAVALIGRNANRLIKLCTTDSETKVAFEVAQKGDA